MSRSISLLFVAVLAVLLAACLPAGAAGQPPTPVEAVSPAAGGDLRPIQVEHVAVEIGVGSPIPVEVIASGTWPDLCAQLAETRQTISGNAIEISLLATPADPNCPPDHAGLAFRQAVPLNVVQLPAGSYTVLVNGATAAFDWQPGVTGPTGPVADPAQVTGVDVVVEGSRAVKSVRVIVSGYLPDTCSQLGGVSLHRQGTSFAITVLANTFETGQPCEAASIPFELAVPLNLTHLPAATYEVNVNGLTATFDPEAVPAAGG
jgi:hypothetical protein